MVGMKLCLELPLMLPKQHENAIKVRGTYMRIFHTKLAPISSRLVFARQGREFKKDNLRVPWWWLGLGIFCSEHR